MNAVEHDVVLNRKDDSEGDILNVYHVVSVGPVTLEPLTGDV